LDDRITMSRRWNFRAAACCVSIGFPPLIFDLEAEQDTDHVICDFKAREALGRGGEIEFHRLPLSRTGKIAPSRELR
jgi:hypothetical protein